MRTERQYITAGAFKNPRSEFRTCTVTELVTLRHGTSDTIYGYKVSFSSGHIITALTIADIEVVSA